MKKIQILGVGAVLTALTVLMYLFGIFSNIEFALRDRLFLDRAVDPDILIIAFDNATLLELGQWPLRRSVVAEGLEKIIAGEPERIGIDVIFADPSRFGEEDDRALEAVLQTSSVPITLPVLGLELSVKGEIVPRAEEILRTLPRFTGEQISYGHVNLILDRDGLVRRFPQVVTNEAGIYIQSFVAETLKIEAEPGVANIVYSGEPGTIPHLSFAAVLKPEFNPEILRDKIVFMGATATDLHDEQPTPVSAGTPMSGVEIQAQIANMIVSGYSLTDVPQSISILWIILLTAFPLFVFFYVANIRTALLSTLALFVTNIVFIVLLFDLGHVLSIVHTSLAVIISGSAGFTLRYFVLDRERREIRNTFSKYVSKDVLEELLNDPSKVKLGGEEREVTILFSDVRGFTTLSEGLSPTELTTFLNRYLTVMTDIILGGRGVVDKYIGDAIMAFWGAPLRNEAHALDAVLSSLAMLKALDAFNEESKDRGEPEINIGIGLNTGSVTVGNMGSHQRFDYTIMGDAVNLGSRLEGQTKDYGVRLLISEHTVRSLTKEEIEAHDLLIRELDRVTVKGKAKPVAIFEVVEYKKREFVERILPYFTALREAYYKGDWERVIACGEKVTHEGEDGPTLALLERARMFRENPPEHWDGVYKLTKK